MLRTTEDLLELRRWAEARGGAPCRSPDGRVGLCFGGDPAPALLVGWDEFGANFKVGRGVAVYAPGSAGCFVGTAAEAHAYVARACEASVASGARVP